MISSFKQPTTVIYTLRSLQILNIQLNEVVRNYIFVVTNSIAILIVVICNIIFVRFYGRLPFIVILSIVVLAWGGIAYLILSYATLGTVNKRSESLIRSWKHNLNLRKVKRDILVKHLESCRPLRMEYGPFGYYKKPATIKVIGILIAYTSKSLIITGKYF